MVLLFLVEGLRPCTILCFNVLTTVEYFNKNVSIGQLLQHIPNSIVVCAGSRPKRQTKTYNKEVCLVSQPLPLINYVQKLHFLGPSVSISSGSYMKCPNWTLFQSCRLQWLISTEERLELNRTTPKRKKKNSLLNSVDTERKRLKFCRRPAQYKLLTSVQHFFLIVQVRYCCMYNTNNLIDVSVLCSWGEKSTLLIADT